MRAKPTCDLHGDKVYSTVHKHWTCVACKAVKAKVHNEKNRHVSLTSKSKLVDKRKGFSNDLTVDFVKGMLLNACSYCGDMSMARTLDRIDNTLGHLQSNVVVACDRCNLFRGDMPYNVWVQLAPTMRKLREDGSLGDWMPLGRKMRKP